MFAKQASTGWLRDDGQSVFAADPFKTFSRFAAQMTIPCFTAATRKRRGDLQERLVVVRASAAAILGSHKRPHTRSSPGSFPFWRATRSALPRKGQCTAFLFFLLFPFSAITRAAPRRDNDIGSRLVLRISMFAVHLLPVVEIAEERGISIDEWGTGNVVNIFQPYLTNFTK